MSNPDGLDDASTGLRRRVSILICSQIHVLALAFVFEMIMLLLAILSLLFGDLNTATRTVLILDFALLGAVIIPTGGLLLHCSRK